MSDRRKHKKFHFNFNLIAQIVELETNLLFYCTSSNGLIVIFYSSKILSVFMQLPSIEVVVKSPPSDRDHRWPPIFVLVICPTRELASQAAAEANKLLKYHPTIGVQVVIGGTRLALEQKRMQANPCQVNSSHS